MVYLHMQESAFSTKEIETIRKPLFQIINTNKIKNKVKLGEMLVELGYDARFGFHYNMVYILKYYDIYKKEGYYQHVDPQTLEDKDMMVCWRCDKKQKYPEFPLGVAYIKARLKICRTCLREENLITGESYTELVGIYSFLQFRYKNVLDKSMYNRFWELAIYGKSSSV